MKKNIITLMLLAFSFTGFSQDFGYYVRGVYTMPIQKEQLMEAQTMSDINAGYPSSWIKEEEYISTEVNATCDGKPIKIVGENDILTTEQKHILAKADSGTSIDIAVKYMAKNSITYDIDVKEMKFSVAIVPKSEAEYPGGNDVMKLYLKEMAVDKISEADKKKFDMATVRFIVNEEGKAIGARIQISSTDNKIDNLLLEVIGSMPNWKPAEDSNGMKVKQEFEFSIGMVMGC